MIRLLTYRLFFSFIFSACFFGTTLAQNQESRPNANTPELQSIVMLSQQIETLIKAGDLAASDLLLKKAIEEMPNRVEPLLIQARLALLQNNTAQALISLENAVDLGFADLDKLLNDPAFAEMQIAQGIGPLLERSAAIPRIRSNPIPAIRQDGKVRIGSENLRWDAKAKRFLVIVDLKNDDNNAPITSPDATGDDIAYLRLLEQQGKACGLKGVLYDNRDRGHSLFKYEQFPQLTLAKYTKPLQKRSVDYGLGNKLTFSTITFGNSSTRYKIKQGGSLPRRSMIWPSEIGRAFQNYTSDHIYVYPGGGRDDYPANWPYTFSSEGNSGSDKWLLRSIVLILAALPCDTRKKLDEENLIAPTVQMIFRRGQLHVLSRETYLTGNAHPAIFDKSVNAPKRMMDLAASIRPQDIPPMVQMRVIKEDFSESAGLAGLNERLVTTPSAIARVWRGWAGRQVIKLSASDTVDPNGRNLTFEWRLLRGDPKHIKIDASGPDATITVDWHTKITRPLGESSKNIRVEIGLFANNGVHDSAPAIFSIHFPSHQKRRYIIGPNGAPRLMSINYDAIKNRRRYDPVLYWSAPWEDQFGYDTNGNLAGWVRKTKTSRRIFSANGKLKNGQDQNYNVVMNSKNLPVLIEQ